MGDRVRFGTLNDSGTPVFSSGFNGFPFPLFSYEDEIEPYVGSSFDLLTAVEMFWRVKKWRLQASIAGDVLFTAPDPDETESFTLEIDYEFDSEAESEIELLTMFGLIESSSSETPSVNVISHTVTAAIGKAFQYVATWAEEPLRYIPNVPVVTLVINSVQFDSGAVPSGGYIATGPDEFAVDSGFTFDFMGQSWPIYKYEPSGTTISSASVNVTPIEFWPYAAADASPIYDTATGARLQDPRN